MPRLTVKPIGIRNADGFPRKDALMVGRQTSAAVLHGDHQASKSTRRQTRLQCSFFLVRRDDRVLVGFALQVFRKPASNLFAKTHPDQSTLFRLHTPNSSLSWRSCCSGVPYSTRFTADTPQK